MMIVGAARLLQAESARRRTAAYGSMNFLILQRAVINNYNSSGLNGQVGPHFITAFV